MADAVEEFVNGIQDALGSIVAGLIFSAVATVLKAIFPFFWLIFILNLVFGAIVALKEALYAGAAFASAYLLVGILIGDWGLTAWGMVAFIVSIIGLKTITRFVRNLLSAGS